MKTRLTLFSAIAFLFFSTVASPLVDEFDHPESQYKPWTFWYWINGNISNEGIVADLEAMAEAGIGGAIIMHVNEDEIIPAGPVPFLSDGYKDALELTFKTAARLGLKINLYNAEGWSSAGGPWITPELSMKRLVWSEIKTTGPAAAPLQFPPAFSALDYYEAIATYAFPTPEKHPTPPFQNLLSSISLSGDTNDDPAHLVDGDWNTAVRPATDPATGTRYLQFEFAAPYTFRYVLLQYAVRGMPGVNRLEVSDDGVSYRVLQTLIRPQIYEIVGHFEIEPVTTRFVRIVFEPHPNKMLLTAMPHIKPAIREVFFGNDYRLPHWGHKAGNLMPKWYASNERNATPREAPAEAIIDPASIINVSQYLRPDGQLDWTPPAGNWTLIRFGMTTTEADNRPATDSGRGLEVDKLSSQALDTHFAGLLGIAKVLAGDQVGKAFASTHIDSWEVGRQNWTQDFPQSFERLRGYSPLPFLPAMIGYIVESEETSERFLWDIRKTISDLICTEYFGGMLQRSHGMGIQFSAQSLNPWLDNMQAMGNSDVAVANSTFPTLDAADNDALLSPAYMKAKMISSSASIYDRSTASESFTAFPEGSKWRNHPALYKPLTDVELAGGVQQIRHHVFSHQPWENRSPGMTLAFWGVHFDRTQTWWHELPTWTDYLSRSQAMLSQGQPVIDVLQFLGDDSSAQYPKTNALEVVPSGYDFELLNADGLLNKLQIHKDGQLSYPNGRTYRILALAPDATLRPEILRKLFQLVQEGAILVGHAPKASPSLQHGATTADAEVRTLAKKIWGGDFQAQIFASVPDALAATQVVKDAHFEPTKQSLYWRHHRVAEENLDYYFVANASLTDLDTTATFRIADRAPELWDPETGKRYQLANYQQKDGVTTVPLQFTPSQSYFVAFPSAPSTSDRLPELSAAAQLTINGPWSIHFQADRGAPATIMLDALVDLSTHSDSGVRYFSGTATYSTIFDHRPQQVKTPLYLDLGMVREIARVRLNGIDLGARLWSPFQFEVTDHLRDGPNTLEIEVTNLWPNRLIGDERMYPDDADWIEIGMSGKGLAKWPAWVQESNDSVPPSGRVTFSTWKHWFADDQLLPSGLIGPVTLRAE